MENDDNKGSFSYISPELQRKNALKVLGIEGIIILIIIVLIFIALNYFGVFKFSDVLQSFVPNAQNTPVTTQTAPKEKQSTSEAAKIPSVPTVQVVSDIPGYSLTLENQDKLMQLLDSWGIFNKEYQSRYGAEGQTIGHPLSHIIAHLTNDKQQTNYFGPDVKNPMASSLTKITPGQFDIYIYIEPSLLQKNDPKSPPGLLFQTDFLISLYKIVNVGKTQQEAQQISNKVLSDFQTNPLMKNEYFVVQKK